MANPAQLLHGLFDRWLNARVSGKPEYDVRGLGSRNADREENFEAQVEAMHHLRQVRRYLDSREAEGKSVDAFRRGYSQWRSWILHYPNAWSNGNIDASSEMTQERLDILEGLGELMEVDAPTVPAAVRSNLLEVLEELWAAIVEADDLPAALRRHLFALISEATYCLRNYEQTGDFSLREALDGLVVATTAARESTSNDGLRQKLSDFLSKMATGYLSGLGVALTAGPIHEAITGGN